MPRMVATFSNSPPTGSGFLFASPCANMAVPPNSKATEAKASRYIFLTRVIITPPTLHALRGISWHDVVVTGTLIGMQIEPATVCSKLNQRAACRLHLIYRKAIHSEA